MKDPTFIKSVRIPTTIEDWKVLRLESAQRKIPVTQLCREQLQPYLDKLKKKHPNA